MPQSLMDLPLNLIILNYFQIKHGCNETHFYTFLPKVRFVVVHQDFLFLPAVISRLREVEGVERFIPEYRPVVRVEYLRADGRPAATIPQKQ